MKTLLNEACDILNDFDQEVAKVQGDWDLLAGNNPHFEQVSPEQWQQKRNRMWLHGETGAWESVELERWLYGDVAMTNIAHSSALAIYTAWKKWLKVAGVSKFKTSLIYDKKAHSWEEVASKEPSDMYYALDDRFDIPKPAKGESLLDFIIWLAQSLEDVGKGHRLGYRALRSFLSFIRKNYSQEQVAFIEHIFPQKMDLQFGKIIRLIPQEAFPIPEKTAAEIVKELARRARSGRPDARHTAIESLALCWLCITAARVRLPKTLDMVREIKATAVLSGAEYSISTTPTYGGHKFWRPLLDSDFSVLMVPTWFGKQPVTISNRLASFLKAVSHLPSKNSRDTILQKPRRSLVRMFDEALKTVAPSPEYGNITYCSLLQSPHIFGDCRPQFKK